MELGIFEIIKEGSSLVILAVVVVYIGKGLLSEVRTMNTNITMLTQEILASRDNDKRLEERYLRIETLTYKIYTALSVAFNGSDVESYRTASQILELDPLKELREKKGE